GLAGTLDGFFPWGFTQCLVKGSVFGLGQATAKSMLTPPPFGMSDSAAMVLSGGVGGWVQGIIMSPLLLLKTRVMTDASFRATGGVWETALASARVGGQVVAKEGVGALMKGSPTFAMKRFFDWTTRFFFVVQLEEALRPEPGAALSHTTRMLCGLGGGTLSALATIPVDVAVATIQDASKAGQKVNLVKTFMEQENLLAFAWSGLSSTSLAAERHAAGGGSAGGFAADAAALSSQDIAQELLSEWGPRPGAHVAGASGAEAVHGMGQRLLLSMAGAAAVPAGGGEPAARAGSGGAGAFERVAGAAVGLLVGRTMRPSDAEALARPAGGQALAGGGVLGRARRAGPAPSASPPALGPPAAEQDGAAAASGALVVTALLARGADSRAKHAAGGGAGRGPSRVLDPAAVGSMLAAPRLAAALVVAALRGPMAGAQERPAAALGALSAPEALSLRSAFRVALRRARCWPAVLAGLAAALRGAAALLLVRAAKADCRPIAVATGSGRADASGDAARAARRRRNSSIMRAAGMAAAMGRRKSVVPAGAEASSTQSLPSLPRGFPRASHWAARALGSIPAPSTSSQRIRVEAALLLGRGSAGSPESPSASGGMCGRSLVLGAALEALVEAAELAECSGSAARAEPSPAFPGASGRAGGAGALVSACCNCGVFAAASDLVLAWAASSGARACDESAVWAADAAMARSLLATATSRCAAVAAAAQREFSGSERRAWRQLAEAAHRARAQCEWAVGRRVTAALLPAEPGAEPGAEPEGADRATCRRALRRLARRYGVDSGRTRRAAGDADSPGRGRCAESNEAEARLLLPARAALLQAAGACDDETEDGSGGAAGLPWTDDAERQAWLSDSEKSDGLTDSDQSCSGYDATTSVGGAPHQGAGHLRASPANASRASRPMAERAPARRPAPRVMGSAREMRAMGVPSRLARVVAKGGGRPLLATDPLRLASPRAHGRSESGDSKVPGRAAPGQSGAPAGGGGSLGAALGFTCGLGLASADAALADALAHRDRRGAFDILDCGRVHRPASPGASSTSTRESVLEDLPRSREARRQQQASERSKKPLVPRLALRSHGGIDASSPFARAARRPVLRRGESEAGGANEGEPQLGGTDPSENLPARLKRALDAPEFDAYDGPLRLYRERISIGGGLEIASALEVEAQRGRPVWGQAAAAKDNASDNSLATIAARAAQALKRGGTSSWSSALGFTHSAAPSAGGDASSPRSAVSDTRARPGGGPAALAAMELARVEEGSREADATQAGGDCEVLFASAGPLLRAATEGPDLLHKSRGKRSARLAKRPDAAPTSGRGLERGGAGVTGSRTADVMLQLATSLRGGNVPEGAALLLHLRAAGEQAAGAGSSAPAAFRALDRPDSLLSARSNRRPQPDYKARMEALIPRRLDGQLPGARHARAPDIARAGMAADAAALTMGTSAGRRWAAAGVVSPRDPLDGPAGGQTAPGTMRIAHSLPGPAASFVSMTGRRSSRAAAGADGTSSAHAFAQRRPQRGAATLVLAGSHRPPATSREPSRRLSVRPAQAGWQTCREGPPGQAEQRSAAARRSQLLVSIGDARAARSGFE
ncbi:SFC1, partial [Symbiodinium sp. KB8]